MLMIRIGDTFGGRFVNQEFRRILQDKWRDVMPWILDQLRFKHNEMSEDQLLETLEERFEIVKRTFGGYIQDEVRRLKVHGLPDREDFSLTEGAFMLSRYAT